MQNNHKKFIQDFFGDLLSSIITEENKTLLSFSFLIAS